MSEYNSYAKRLDEAFRKAREEFIELFKDYKKADEKATNATRKENENDIVFNMRVAQYVEQANVLKKALREEKKKIFNNLQKEMEQIRAELVKAVQGDNIADPDKVDSNALELMHSGVLTVDDIEAFRDRYDTNPTMLRLVGKYAKERAEEPTVNGLDRQRLNMVAEESKNGTSRKVAEFDSIMRAAETYACLHRPMENPEYIVSISQHWDDLSNVIENY